MQFCRLLSSVFQEVMVCEVRLLDIVPKCDALIIFTKFNVRWLKAKNMRFNQKIKVTTGVMVEIFASPCFVTLFTKNNLTYN